jgi:Ca2+-binding EF-hand superfamily protein
MMRRARIAFGVAVFGVMMGVGIGRAGGDAAPLPLRGPIPFEWFDLDGNGAISEVEFERVHDRRDEAREKAGLPPTRRRHSFGDVDGDGDGQITSEELRSVHGAGGAGRGRGRGMGRGPGMGRGVDPPVFSEFDSNGDGAIDEPEFAEGRAARVTARAQEGRQLRGMATAPPFAELDTDGDGRLTPEEFAAGVRGHWQGTDHGMPGEVRP